MRRLHARILDAEMVKPSKKIIFQKASLLKRFLNLVIDYLTILHFSIFVGVLLGVLFVFFQKEEWLVIFDYEIANFLISGGIVFFYYFCCEFFFKGKTLGKYATQTSVRKISGQIPQTNDIFVRSLLRLIPFEPITILFGKKLGWHDEFSATMVVEDVY